VPNHSRSYMTILRGCGPSRPRLRHPSAGLLKAGDLPHGSEIAVSVLSRRTLDSREVDCCIRPVVPLDCLDAPSIPVDVSDQACGIDSQVLRRVAPHLVRSSLKERDRAHEVTVLEMVVGRADLDQTLKEESWLAMLLTPDLLEDLVGLEEILLVEQADSLLDWVQTGTVRDGRHPAGRTSSHRMKLCGYGFVTSSRQTPPRSVTVKVYPFRSARIGIDEVAVASLSVRISTVVPCGNDSSASFAWMKGYGHSRPRVSTTPLGDRLASVVTDVASMVSLR